MYMPHEKTLSLFVGFRFIAHVFVDQTFVKREFFLVWLFVLKDNKRVF